MIPQILLLNMNLIFKGVNLILIKQKHKENNNIGGTKLRILEKMRNSLNYGNDRSLEITVPRRRM